MGMSIKEAMAASRPVIGSLAGGIPEAIVDEETGFLVPLDATRHIDASQLLDRIERLVVDADLRTGMGEAARRRAEAMFSMERTIDRMGEIFVAAMPA
jgi:glycosyltransferase involved in cell wall biosynthesis